MQGCQTSAAQAQSTVSMRPQTNAAQALVGLAFQGGGGRPVSFHNAAERAATPSLPGSFKAGGDAFISKSSSVRATPDAQRPVRLPIAQRSSLPAPASQKMEHHDSSIGSKPANDLPVNDKARIEDTFDLVSIDNEDLLPLHTSYTSIKSVDDVASLTQSGSESLVERLTQKVNVASSASALHSPKDDCARPPPYLIGLQVPQPPFKPRESLRLLTCSCVCVRACACVRACVRACGACVLCLCLPGPRSHKRNRDARAISLALSRAYFRGALQRLGGLSANVEIADDFHPKKCCFSCKERCGNFTCIPRRNRIVCKLSPGPCSACCFVCRSRSNHLSGEFGTRQCCPAGIYLSKREHKCYGHLLCECIAGDTML